MIDLLVETCLSWGLKLNQRQQDQFVAYAAALLRWNQQINLTSINDEQGVVTRHFLDSLRCALSWGEAPASLIDIGAGAGFPGVPLKILRPELQLTLVESVAKKAAFLEELVTLLGLADVQIVVARAEKLGQDTAYREQYDLAVGRAVAELRVLAEYCLPLCRIGGRFLAPKGPHVDQEVERAQAAIVALGGRIVAIEPADVPGLEPRTLVVIDKVASTPPRYPRANGIPAKRPL